MGLGRINTERLVGSMRITSMGFTPVLTGGRACRVLGSGGFLVSHGGNLVV